MIKVQHKHEWKCHSKSHYFLQYVLVIIIVKILVVFLAKMEALTLKFLLKYKESGIDKTILKQKNKVRAFKPPDCKPFYKISVIKNVWCCHKMGT
jgi:hypothetical protein